jgi:hypothetical protein
MGKGKGNHLFWVYPLKKGQIFLEIKFFFFNKILYKSINKILKTKLPFNFLIIKKKI